MQQQPPPAAGSREVFDVTATRFPRQAKPATVHVPEECGYLS